MSNVYSTKLYQARVLDPQGNPILQPWTTDESEALRQCDPEGWVIEVDVSIDDRYAKILGED